MTDLPKFQRYTQANPSAAARIQPSLGLREWDALTDADKKNVVAQLMRLNWLDAHSRSALWAVSRLNEKFMRLMPGKRVHNTIPDRSPRYGNEDYNLLGAGYTDFCDIVLTSSHDVVMELFSGFAEATIDGFSYQAAEKEKDLEKRAKYIEDAFEKFDRFKNCLNEVFEQFEINQVVSRNGFAPRQDRAIQEALYEPAMALLADPKWRDVSGDIAEMFSEYRNRRYAETITKAHSATQRFFQILAGEGKNGQGELSKLVATLRQQGVLPARDNFIGPVSQALLGFLPSERATNSTAKPSLRETQSSEALLVINVVLILIQYCLRPESPVTSAN